MNKEKRAQTIQLDFTIKLQRNNSCLFLIFCQLMVGHHKCRITRQNVQQTTEILSKYNSIFKKFNDIIFVSLTMKVMRLNKETFRLNLISDLSV